MPKCQIPKNDFWQIPPPIQTPIFSPYPKIQNSTSYFSIPTPEVHKKVGHAPVGQKLREEIDFLETGCFQPRAVPLNGRNKLEGLSQASLSS
jgi:hypothetical protein